MLPRDRHRPTVLPNSFPSGRSGEAKLAWLRLNRASGEGRDRTSDTAIFSRVLYQLSYLAAPASVSHTAGDKKRPPGRCYRSSEAASAPNQTTPERTRQVAGRT